ncbi:ankyrin repeat-containing domain protein, partial [Microdochium bolleyi]
MHRDVLKSLIAADDVENAAALLRKHSDKVQLTKEMFEEAYIWGETSRKHHNAYAEYVCKDKAQQLVMLLLQHASARSLMRRRRRHISGYAQREAAIDESLLLYASGRGHDDIIQRLIEIGVDIDVRSNVYLGIRSRFKVFETFAMPARKPLRTMTALECAAAAGHLNAVAILISNGAKLFYEYETLPTSMVLAVAQGHLKVVQFLMQRDEKVKYVDAESHLRLVKLAVQNGRCETTKFLLEHRIQVLGHARGMAASKDALQSHRSPSIVVLAMMSGCPDMLEIILSSGFHDGIGVREDLVTALEYAALMPNASFVYTLLR